MARAGSPFRPAASIPAVPAGFSADVTGCRVITVTTYPVKDSERWGRRGRSPPTPPGPGCTSLDIDLGAGRLELLLQLLGLRLRNAPLHLLGRSFHQVLRLLEAEARDGADFLDDVDLVRAHLGQDDRELGLLLDRGSRGRGARHHHRRGGSRDAPLLLELLHQIRGLHHREAGELVDDRVQISHGPFPFPVRRASARRPLCWTGASGAPAVTYRQAFSSWSLRAPSTRASCWPGVAIMRASLDAGWAMTAAICPRSSWIPGSFASAWMPLASTTLPSITAVRIEKVSRPLAKSTRIFAGATTST